MALSLLHADTFTRSDGALDASTMSDGLGTWSAGGSFAVSSNQCAGDNGDAGGWDSAMSDVADQAAEADIIDGDSGVLVRHSAGGNNTYYLAYRSGAGTGVTLYRRDSGGGFTSLSSAGDLTLGSKLTIEAIGSALRVLIDDVETGSATDSTYASGRAGIYKGTVDDFNDYVDAGSASILPLVACDMRNISDMGGMRG